MISKYPTVEQKTRGILLHQARGGRPQPSGSRISWNAHLSMPGHLATWNLEAGGSCNGRGHFTRSTFSAAVLRSPWRGGSLPGVAVCSHFLHFGPETHQQATGFPRNQHPALSSWPGRLFFWHLLDLRFQSQAGRCVNLDILSPAWTRSRPLLPTRASQTWNLYSCLDFPFPSQNLFKTQGADSGVGRGLCVRAP